jgi:integrase
MDRSYEQRVFRKIREGDSRFSEEARLANKHREIQSGTTKEFSVPRMALEFNGFDCSVREGEGTRVIPDGIEVESVFQKGENSAYQAAGVSNREIIRDTVTVFGGQPLLIGDESSESASGQGEYMVRTGEASSSTVERLRMVERQLEEELSNFPSGTATRGGTVDGCLPFRMGGACAVEEPGRSNDGTGSTWILGEQLELQSERVGSSAGSDSTLPSLEANRVDPPLACAYRQFDNSIQYQQESLHPQFNTANEEIVQLDDSIIDDDRGSSYKRFGESKGGQLVKDEQVGRLQVESPGTSAGVADVRCSDIDRSICIESEPPTRSVLFTIKQRSDEFSKERIQHTLEGEGGTIDSPSSTTVIEMSTESKGGKDSGSSNCTALVGSGMDSTPTDDDSEDDSDGRVEVIIAPRKVDDKTPRQAASGVTSRIFGGRRNDEGQQMVLSLLRKRGLSEISDWFFKSVAESTWRNYRRGFTLFSKLLRKSGVDPLTIGDVNSAVAALIRALKVACEIKSRLSTILLMKTAVIRLFSFMFNVDLSHMPMVKMALRCLTLSELPHKEMLRLGWSVDQLLVYLTRLPVFSLMEFNQLTAVAVVLCMAFTALRFSEIYNLDIQETTPDKNLNEWKFWVHVKGHDFKEPVTLHKIDNCHLDPIGALWTLRSRIYALQAVGNKKPTSFWFSLLDKEYIPLSYDGVRLAAMRILHQAGINESRPYHIKHAVLTCLHEGGASAKDIAAFARHRFESMAAYQHYISYDGGKMSVRNIVQSINRNSHPN